MEKIYDSYLYFEKKMTNQNMSVIQKSNQKFLISIMNQNSQIHNQVDHNQDKISTRLKFCLNEAFEQPVNKRKRNNEFSVIIVNNIKNFQNIIFPSLFLLTRSKNYRNKYIDLKKTVTHLMVPRDYAKNVLNL